MNKCECDKPGYCKRHMRKKYGRSFYLCQRSQAYRDKFEEEYQQTIRTLAVGPGMVSMFRSVFMSLILWAWSGFKLTDATNRNAFCNSCPGNTGWRCRPCGCFLWLKTRMPHESCPAGLWGPNPITQPSIDPVTDELVQIETPKGGCGCAK